MKAIVIEYEPTILEMIRLILKKIGYEVITATNTKEATGAIDAHNDAEIVIIGRGKNHGDCGLIIARYVKGLPGQRKIIMITGYPDDVFSAEATILGATVLVKPFSIDGLLRACGLVAATTK